MSDQRVKTTAHWARRLYRGPWHILTQTLYGRTACGRQLKGELERSVAPADGPRDGTVCHACVTWAHEPKVRATA